MEKSLKRKGILKMAFLVGVFLMLALSLAGCGTTFEPPKPDALNNKYFINNYSVDIEVGENNVYRINEKITVTLFSGVNGIVRSIPTEQTIGVPSENGKRKVKNYRFEISNFEVNNTEDFIDSVGSYADMWYEGENYGEPYRYFYLYLPEYMGGREGGEGDFPTFTFDFSYTYDLGEDRDTTKDFVYFNIIGNLVDTHIGQVEFSITLPKDVGEDISKLKFYAGNYGNDDECDITYQYETADKAVLSGKMEPTKKGYFNFYDTTAEGEVVPHAEDCALYYGEALTVYLPLEEGYFNVPRSFTFDIVLLCVFLALVVILIVFYIRHRRKNDLIDVVEFKAPDGLTPTEAGYIIDRTVSGDDVTALIVYWASKGYVAIEEKEKKIYIKKVKDLTNGKPHEIIFFNSLFATNTTIDTSSLKSFSPLLGQKISNSIKKEGKKYFNHNVDGYYHISLVAIFVAMVLTIVRIDLQSLNYLFMILKIFLAFIGLALLWRLPNIEKFKHKQKKSKVWTKKILLLVFSLACFIGIILMSEAYCDPFFMRIFLPLVPVALFFIYPYFQIYTKEGLSYLGRLRGLKQYIEVAEKDRIEAMVKENPTLFYDVLPYAYVLGVSDVYMKKFESIPLQPPAWLNTDNVLTLYLTIHLLNHNMARIGVLVGNTMVKAMVKEVAKIAATVAISNIGDGGGGFSGGGAGGGGVSTF